VPRSLPTTRGLSDAACAELASSTQRADGYGRGTREAGVYASSRREEMHMVHDILPLPVALNGTTEERDEMEPER
jgi:hypothetical protein